MLDHIFDSRHGSHIALVTALSAQQVDHVLGGVHIRIGDIAVFIGVGIRGLITLLALAWILDDFRHFDAGHSLRQLGLEYRRKRRRLGSALEYHILPAVGAAFGRAGGL